jgi:hypothetical protein
MSERFPIPDSARIGACKFSDIVLGEGYLERAEELFEQAGPQIADDILRIEPLGPEEWPYDGMFCTEIYCSCGGLLEVFDVTSPEYVATLTWNGRLVDTNAKCPKCKESDNG